MSKESTKSAKVAYLKSKEQCHQLLLGNYNRNYLPVPNLLADSDVF